METFEKYSYSSLTSEKAFKMVFSYPDMWFSLKNVNEEGNHKQQITYRHTTLACGFIE